MPQGYFSYNVVTDGQSSERKILVVNGLPFYLSSATSEDKEEIIAPAWREGLWMPLAGVKTAPKPGQISKLGEHTGDTFSLENQIKGILKSIYESMNKEEVDALLQTLLLEKFKTEKYSDPSSSSYTSPQLIRDGLAGQLTRFGTMEAMIISMKISPAAWTKNALLSKFRDHILELCPQSSMYDAWNLPSSVNNAPIERSITVNQDNQAERNAAALQINDWLLNQIVRPTSMTKSGLLVGFGVLSLISGSLILGDILNIGLLSGVGGAVMSGLTTAAACTGIGLLILAGILIGIGIAVGCYQSCMRKQEVMNFVAEQNPTRSAINTFLLKNCTPEQHQRLTPAPQVSSNPAAFFSNSVQALGRIFGCSEVEAVNEVKAEI